MTCSPARFRKAAALPARHDLDLFDHNYSQGITAPRLRELRRLGWLEQNYNLILMGPSGTGKTFIAAGLVYEAAGQGYKAYMVTMEDVINTIKMKTLMPSAMSAYNRLLKADLVAIDDIMLFPVKKEDAAGFFNLINTLHEKASLIITTNKAPTEWGKTLDDEVLASAILDRLLYHYEVIKLTGQSYRMGNRKSIFEEDLLITSRLVLTVCLLSYKKNCPMTFANVTYISSLLQPNEVLSASFGCIVS